MDGSFHIHIVYANTKGFRAALKLNEGGHRMEVRPLLDSETLLPPAADPIPEYFPPDIPREFTEGNPLSGICAALEKSEMQITASSVQHGNPASVFLDRRPLFFVSEDAENSWIECRFLTGQVRLAGVVLMSCPFAVNDIHLRTFSVEASVDAETFLAIANVENCAALNKPEGCVFLKFECPPVEIVRIYQRGRNWKGTFELAIANVDFLGTFEDFTTWAERMRIKEVEANRIKIAKLEAKIAAEQKKLAAIAVRKSAVFRESKRKGPRLQLRKNMESDRMTAITFMQFRDCFELPLRKALPKLSETDVDWWLQTMFEHLPESLKPLARR
jgi:hypothetical protein